MNIFEPVKITIIFLTWKLIQDGTSNSNNPSQTVICKTTVLQEVFFTVILLWKYNEIWAVSWAVAMVITYQYSLICTCVNIKIEQFSFICERKMTIQFVLVWKEQKKTIMKSFSSASKSLFSSISIKNDRKIVFTCEVRWKRMLANHCTAAEALVILSVCLRN